MDKVDNETLDFFGAMDIIKCSVIRKEGDNSPVPSFSPDDLATRVALLEAKVISLETKLNGR